jgi:hypothetical protein
VNVADQYVSAGSTFGSEAAMTHGPTGAKTESELWQELIQSQEAYAQALARLDELVLDSDTMQDRYVIEEAAERRRAAYAKYRQAMDELAEYNRK